MTRILGAIVYNWPLKLAAIALATLLYAGLVVSQSTFEYPGPVQVTVINQPKDVVILGNLPTVTRIRYIANGDFATGPTPDSFRATIDLAGADPAAGSQYRTIDVVSNDPRFLPTDWEPRGINVQLDPLKQYEVPVTVNPGKPPANLDVRLPAQLSQRFVTVYGPDSIVKNVVAAQADVLIDPSGVPVDRDVPLIPVDQLGNRVSPVRVEPSTVHVTIAVFSNAQKKTLAVNPAVTGTPPNGYEVDTITVTPTTVVVEGNPDQLATMTRADTASIPIGGATSQIDTDVELALPAGVLPIGPTTVHVTITLKAETGTRTFEAGLLPVGRQANLDYRFTTLTVFVVVAGPIADLDRLDPSSFTVPLDRTGLGPGVHQVTPEPNLQAGLGLLSIDPAVVTVTVTAIASAPPSGAPPGG